MLDFLTSRHRDHSDPSSEISDRTMSDGNIADHSPTASPSLPPLSFSPLRLPDCINPTPSQGSLAATFGRDVWDGDLVAPGAEGAPRRSSAPTSFLDFSSARDSPSLKVEAPVSAPPRLQEFESRTSRERVRTRSFIEFDIEQEPVEHALKSAGSNGEGSASLRTCR